MGSENSDLATILILKKMVEMYNIIGGGIRIVARSEFSDPTIAALRSEISDNFNSKVRVF